MPHTIDDSVIIRTHLRRYMKRLGMSARHTSLQTGMGQDLVKNILAKKSKSPRESTMRKLADALGVTPADLNGDAALAGLTPADASAARRQMIDLYSDAERLREDAAASGDDVESFRLREAANAIDHIDGPYDDGPPPAPQPTGAAQIAPPPGLAMSALGETDTLPVYATQAANADTMTVQPIAREQIPRPHPMTGGSGGFCLYMIGDTMAPVIEQGDLVIVDEFRPPTRGRNVVLVEVKTTGDWRARVCNLVDYDAETWTVKSFNPAQELTLPREKWPAAYTIVGKFDRR